MLKTWTKWNEIKKIHRVGLSKNGLMMAYSTPKNWLSKTIHKYKLFTIRNAILWLHLCLGFLQSSYQKYHSLKDI